MATYSNAPVHLPPNAVYGNYGRFTFCERLEDVTSDSLVPNIDIEAIGLMGFKKFTFCKVNDIREDPRDELDALKTAVSKLAEHDKLYYFTVRKNDQGETRIGPMRCAERIHNRYGLLPPRPNSFHICIKPGDAHKYQMAPPPLLLRLPTGTEHLQSMYKEHHENFGHDFVARSFCSGNPVDISFIDKYVDVLRLDKNKQPATSFAHAINCTTADKSAKGLELLEAFFRSACEAFKGNQSFRTFVPCWTAEHSCLLVIRPNAQSTALIEVWDPVPNDERFKWQKTHFAIQPLLRLLGVPAHGAAHAATVKFELTHICKLPTEVEKHASGLFVMYMMKRFSRRYVANEELDMRELLRLEASQSPVWESDFIKSLQQSLFRETMITGQLPEPKKWT